MLKNLLLFLSLLFIMVGCSGISVISKKDIQDLYSKEFLNEVRQIKLMYGQGELGRALTMLKSMDETKLVKVEKALKRNLIGVIFFAEGKYENAIFNFDMALNSSKEDPNLTSQIYLNLSSSYFKLGFYEKAYDTISNVNSRYLSGKESEKHFKLQYRLAKELSDEKGAINALVNYLRDAKDISSLKSKEFFSDLTQRFFNLSDRERLRILEEFEEHKYISIGFLGYLEAEKIYYSGQKEAAKDLLSWIKQTYAEYESLSELIDNFNNRIQKFIKIDSNAIGVVLPFTGKRKSFGVRSLRGIDSAIKGLSKRLGREIKLIIRDSKGKGVVGAHYVRELIEEHNVSAIIGGLFTNEAEKEYLESRKHGVLFLSLSQIYLPKEKKDHLLIEIPGSVESQIQALFSRKMIESFGDKVAILYPRSERGRSYRDEFWRKSQESDIKVTNIISFEKSSTDYRDPVKNLLGLKHTRIRQEEYDLLKEIHSLEKKSSIRRVQTLRPDIDFDWLFVPAFPKDALQLIPAFSYFDAFNLSIFGGPSWRSNSLSSESYKLGKLHFLGEDVQSIDQSYLNNFMRAYKTRPRIIELRSSDAINILSEIFVDENFETRDELDIHVRSLNQIVAMTGSWELNEGVWLKRMDTLTLHRGKIKKTVLTPREKSQQENDI